MSDIARPPGRPKEYVNVRVNSGMKQQLTELAAKEGLDLSNYMRKHYLELVQSGSIYPEEDVRIPNPSSYPPTVPQGFVPPAQPQYYGQPPPYYYPPPPYATQPTGPDQLDIFIGEMRKLMLSQMMGKMMMDMQKGGTSAEDFVRAYRGQDGKKDDFSMQDIMKMQMMQNAMDRQYQQQREYAQQQYDRAHAQGDKAGESKALELITALSTASMQQQQNFMQQLMLAQQNSSSLQQTMFNTAMQGSRAQDDARAQERNQFTQQVMGLTQQMGQIQIAGLERANQIQVEFLKADLERIRTEPKKDVIAQMGELLNLRETNPVYKAAFNAAFGIKDESGWASMIPKLKELGVDQVINKITTILGNIVSKPQIPQPTMPQTESIPIPMPQPTPEELQKLSQTGLPQTPGQPQPQPRPQPQPETVIPIEKPDNVGYSNLEAQKPVEERMQIQTPTESIQIPAPETGYSNLDVQRPEPQQPQPQPEPQPETVSEESRAFTVGRPKGAKNKPKEPPQQ